MPKDVSRLIGKAAEVLNRTVQDGKKNSSADFIKINIMGHYPKSFTKLGKKRQ
jgi:hypothetical protein